MPQDLQSKWKRRCVKKKELGELKIGRYYFPGVFSGGNNSIEIHIFWDAPIITYGSVTYVRYESENGEVTTSFFKSKSRIDPLKILSLT